MRCPPVFQSVLVMLTDEALFILIYCDEHLSLQAVVEKDEKIEMLKKELEKVLFLRGLLS